MERSQASEICAMYIVVVCVGDHTCAYAAFQYCARSGVQQLLPEARKTKGRSRRAVVDLVIRGREAVVGSTDLLRC